MDRFSDKYPRIATTRSDVESLKIQLSSSALPILGSALEFVSTPRNHIGALGTITLDVGSDSDLRSNEPVLIEFSDVNDIEHSEISVYPDRTDFPFERFPHINYPVGEMPPSLCLTRENFNDWYSEHTFADLVTTIREWYIDASKGNLIKLKDGDFYEPFRVLISDVFLFKAPIEDTFIEKFNEAGINIGSYYQKDSHLLCDFGSDNEKKAIHVLLYRDARITLKEWFVKMPETIQELQSFLKEQGFISNIQAYLSEKTSQEIDISKVDQMVIQVAFVRPALVLGKSSKVDSLYFSISLKDILDSNFDAPIKPVTVYDFATTELARHISKTPDSIKRKKILLLGCGAIGSKLAYHLFRSGICNLTICDNDVMQSHNVCRHALTYSNFLTPKVDLLKKELLRMFLFNPDHITVVNENILKWLPTQDLNAYDLIIDATASSSVLYNVETCCSKVNTPVIRFALSDGGQVGLVYCKINEDCSLLDYYMHLLTEASKGNDDLSRWLTAEQAYNYDRVRIGEGCHSNTMILSDDTISIHTGIASNIIRNIFERPVFKNSAYLSFVNDEYIGQVYTEAFDLPKYTSIKFENDASWKLRLPTELLGNIHHIAKVAKSKETGGYLLGYVDVKHRIIYVLNHFEPKEISSTHMHLKLGVDGWKEYYDVIRKKTSKIIDYIGDWHSHPVGTLKQSQIDMDTNAYLINEEIPSQVGVCVITNKKSTKAYLLKRN